MRESAVLDMPKRPSPRLVVTEPGNFSSQKFAAAWDTYHARHPELTRGDLLDRLREVAWYIDRRTGKPRMPSGATVYSWRKGLTRPDVEQAGRMAQLLGVKPDALRG